MHIPSLLRIPRRAAGLVGLALLTANVGGVIPALAGPTVRGDVDTCVPGYVWREAVPGDHVCVTPATRDQAAYDNAHAAERVDPVNHSYGPDTCIQGYVWREAVPGDHVCVTPEVRDQTALDNRLAPTRVLYGGGTAISHVHAPDLEVGLDGPPYADYVQFYVRNVGDQDSRPFRISVIGDQGFLLAIDDPGIAAGAVHVHTFVGGAPRERLTIFVDLLNVTGDPNGSNNVLIVQLPNFGSL